ncbi:MAG TPA: amidase [Dehalococcoidia bacterium]|nr:amidase [Dehalococcoidia bacterium]
MKPGQLVSLTLTLAARLVAARELSPVEVIEACLERIEKLEPRLNAFITRTPELALEAARAAEAEIARGRYRGPLHGLPLVLKDIFAWNGVRLTAGSRVIDQIDEEDATVIARLKEAGAVLLGKTNLHEIALGVTGVNPHWGSPRNPWDTGRISGGSSSGTAVAVAAGLGLGGPGTDTGGSVRIPAALCGLVGLKPTYGRVSRHGVIPLSWSLDHVGPICKTVEDAALMLSVLAGPDPKDSSSSSWPAPDYRRALARGVRGLRIGVPREHFFDGVEPEIESAVHEALRVMEGLGAEIQEITLPLINDVPEAVSAIMLPEAAAYHQRYLQERPQDYGDDVRFRLELGALHPAVLYIQAQRLRTCLGEEWRRVFDRIDLLVTPTTALTALTIEECSRGKVLSYNRLTNPFNLSGQPAISLPCGFSSLGLPIGLQLVGRWWEEETVLQAAYAYEQATDWHRHRPPL